MNHNPSPLATSAGGTLSLAECLHWMRRQLRLASLATEALADKLLLAGASEAGLGITDAELQQAANRWRRRHGLDGAQQTQDWLAANGLSPLDLQANLEAELLIARFKEQLGTTGLDERFQQQAERFARVRLTRVVASDEGLARELLNQINEGGDLANLAKQHGLTLEGPVVVYRAQLPADQAKQIFAATTGSVLGPLAGTGFSLIRIEEFLPAERDQVVSDLLARAAVDEWLGVRLRDVKIDWSVLA